MNNIWAQIETDLPYFRGCHFVLTHTLLPSGGTDKKITSAVKRDISPLGCDSL